MQKNVREQITFYNEMSTQKVDWHIFSLASLVKKVASIENIYFQQIVFVLHMKYIRGFLIFCYLKISPHKNIMKMKKMLCFLQLQKNPFFRTRLYSTISNSSLGRLAFHGSFSPSKTANQNLPVYEEIFFPSKTFLSPTHLLYYNRR